MPPKATGCGGESVVVSVYVERPRRRFSSLNPRCHCCHHHQKIGGGCNRRAELLVYSQQLRKAAHSQAVGPAPPHHSHCTTNHPQRKTKVTAVGCKRKHFGTPTCQGDWKNVLVPRFIKAWISHQRKEERKKSKKQHAISATNKVQKKWGCITQFFPTTQKKR